MKAGPAEFARINAATAALRASNRAFDAVYLSEDALEGPQSFREKRKPVWKGR